MRIPFATVLASMFIAVSAALAQTTAPAPAPAPAAPAGGIGDYWWLIILALVIAGAAWYFMRGKRTRI
jgi:hypothetical protein